MRPVKALSLFLQIWRLWPARAGRTVTAAVGGGRFRATGVTGAPPRRRPGGGSRVTGNRRGAGPAGPRRAAEAGGSAGRRKRRRQKRSPPAAAPAPAGPRWPRRRGGDWGITAARLVRREPSRAGAQACSGAPRIGTRTRRAARAASPARTSSAASYWGESLQNQKRKKCVCRPVESPGSQRLCAVLARAATRESLLQAFGPWNQEDLTWSGRYNPPAAGAWHCRGPLRAFPQSDEGQRRRSADSAQRAHPEQHRELHQACYREDQVTQ